MPCNSYTEAGYFEMIQMVDAVKSEVVEQMLMGIGLTYSPIKYGYVITCY